MYDLIIIGSGPAGLTAAIYAGRAFLKTLVIEKEYEGTGQIAESGKVDNYPGLPGISGYDLGEKFLEHAQEFGTEFRNQEVTEIAWIDPADGKEETASGFYRIQLEDGSTLDALAVIYAAGASPRKAGIPGEEKFLGKGVSFCALCDGAFYAGKKVAVLGGGDTALDDALYLSDIAETVYLIHRRSEFRGARATQRLIEQKKNIVPLLENQVVEIEGKEKLNYITLANGHRIAVDGVFVAFGSLPQTELVRNLVEQDEAGYLVSGEDGVTYHKNSSIRRSGFYAAGDVRTKKLRQVSTAIADGANAVVSAAEYIRFVKELL